MTFKAFTILFTIGWLQCQSQNTNTMTNNKSNPLICDPEIGACEIPSAQTKDSITFNTEQKKPVKIIYFTDPICSSCWGIEPQLRKLKLEYGNNIEIEYRMGGLLRDWSYNSGGISKPSDVAHHWDEVSQYYDMPIDGNVWLEDPLSSSYPPSIAFKAAQMQDELKALKFLRIIKEMVFLKKKNITKWEYLSKAATEVELDIIKLKTDYETTAEKLFEADLELAKKMGVRGFPTLFFIDSLNNQHMVYGFKPYSAFEDAVIKTSKTAVKVEYQKDWKYLFEAYPTLTTREFSELSGLVKSESENLLQKLTDEKKLEKAVTRNGPIWSTKTIRK